MRGVNCELAAIGRYGTTTAHKCPNMSTCRRVDELLAAVLERKRDEERTDGPVYAGPDS